MDITASNAGVRLAGSKAAPPDFWFIFLPPFVMGFLTAALLGWAVGFWRIVWDVQCGGR